MRNCGFPNEEQILIVQGEDVTIALQLLDIKTKLPIDLTTASEIIVSFPSTNDAGFIEKKLSLSQVSITSGPLGLIAIPLVPVDTNALTPGAAVSIEVRVTISSLLNIIQLPNALIVNEALFPNS